MKDRKRKKVVELPLQTQNTATLELMEARHNGSLTPERYAELLKKGLAEIDAFMALIPEQDRWIRHDLEAHLRAYDPDS